MCGIIGNFWAKFSGGFGGFLFGWLVGDFLIVFNDNLIKPEGLCRPDQGSNPRPLDYEENISLP